MAVAGLKKLSKDYLAEVAREEAEGRMLHPYKFLEALLRDKNARGETIEVPLSIKILAATALMRVRLAVLTESKTQLNGDMTVRPATVTSVDVVAALASCDEATRRKILTGAGVLRLESGDTNDAEP